MWVVKNAKGEVIAVLSRKEDAEAIANTKIDKSGPYTVEEGRSNKQ